VYFTHDKSCHVNEKISVKFADINNKVIKLLMVHPSRYINYVITNMQIYHDFYLISPLVDCGTK
jgi:hypothetical protein